MSNSFSREEVIHPLDRNRAILWLEAAAAGDKPAREKLIEQYRPFIYKEAQRICRRPLEWGRDDELSIALIAFNEAIDAYQASKGGSFHQLCKLVIKRRLIDYFRHNEKANHALASDELVSRASIEEDWERNEREAEVETYQRILNDFKLTFEIVAQNQPKHKPTREQLRRAAQVLAAEQELLEYLHHSGNLPKRRLCELAGVTPRMLDRGRIYVIALALLLADERLPHLQAYARELTAKGGS